VFLAMSRRTGKLVALQRMEKVYIDLDSFEREVDVLLRIGRKGGDRCINGFREFFDDVE
jgi:hypothetical protein